MPGPALFPTPWLFYACENSYFSAKVRPALRFKRVFFEERLPTPRAYREVIVPRTGLGFIPVVITSGDEVWQDTSVILDRLEAQVPEPALYPATPAQRMAAFLLELYADEFMVLPAMHYRWATAEGEAAARADFAAFSGDVETSKRFADRMSGSLRALGVVPETAGAIEAHLADLLDALCAHFAEHRFLLGARPSLADCALMGPLYAHLRLDPVPGRLLQARAVPVLQWIERMNHPDDEDRAGAWAADDALPETLLRVLRLVGRDALPLLRDNLAAADAWADANARPGVTPPRAVGFHETALRGVRVNRYTSPYGVWMWQRPLAAWEGCDEAGRRRIESALAGTGCELAWRAVPRHRLDKSGLQLVYTA